MDRPDDAAGAGAPGGEEDGAPVTVKALERNILLAGTVAVAALLLLSRLRMVPGALLGAGLVWLNFRLLRSILGRALAEGGTIRRRFAAQYLLKFLGYAAAVFLVVRSGWFDVGGFLVGLSTLVAAVLLEWMFRAAEGKKNERENR